MAHRLLRIMEQKPVALVVSLPENHADLARAAEAAGADAVKVHVNVTHRASGLTFGTLAEERPALERILSAVRIPVGIVPGGGEGARPETLEALQAMGFDFLDMYVSHYPASLLPMVGMTRIAALEAGGDWEFVRGLNRWPVEAFEASIVPSEDYGRHLTLADLNRYAMLTAALDRPVIVPSQKRLVPQDVPLLAQAGVKAIMIGVVCTGKSVGELERVTAGFARAVAGL